ncbi:MAG: DUF4160 domain-containing protein [Flavobacteriaceae bacterium]|nr:DUF4160 domain-containing protein [Flavobacteriaceae bacterium]
MPHIYVKYQGEWSVFSIPEGEIIEGELNSEKVKLVQAWIIDTQRRFACRLGIGKGRRAAFLN